MPESGQWQRALCILAVLQISQPNPQRNEKKIRKMYAIKQIKICAEYRDMLPRPRLDLSGTPGFRPISLSPGSWQTSLGLGSMSRYSAQILICIIMCMGHYGPWYCRNLIVTLEVLHVCLYDVVLNACHYDMWHLMHVIISWAVTCMPLWYLEYCMYAAMPYGITCMSLWHGILHVCCYVKGIACLLLRHEVLHASHYNMVCCMYVLMMWGGAYMYVVMMWRIVCMSLWHGALHVCHYDMGDCIHVTMTWDIAYNTADTKAESRS